METETPPQVLHSRLVDQPIRTKLFLALVSSTIIARSPRERIQSRITHNVSGWRSSQKAIYVLEFDQMKG